MSDMLDLIQTSMLAVGVACILSLMVTDTLIGIMALISIVLSYFAGHAEGRRERTYTEYKEELDKKIGICGGD